MLLSYAQPQEVDKNIVWSKPEDVFEYMRQNRIARVSFHPANDVFGGLDEKSFQNFSRKLFDDIKELANAKTWHSSGAFDPILMKHNDHVYRIDVFESHANPFCAYDTIHMITITE